MKYSEGWTALHLWSVKGGNKEIGEILQTGEMPDPLLGCEQADEPNLISREGDIIRISHPDPGIYGYREIFVNSSDPEPSLIE